MHLTDVIIVSDCELEWNSSGQGVIMLMDIMGL